MTSEGSLSEIRPCVTNMWNFIHSLATSTLKIQLTVSKKYQILLTMKKLVC